MKRYAPEERFEEPPLWQAAAESEKRATQNRAELGMTRAATKADHIDPAWRVAALEAVRLFARTHKRFLAEEVRASFWTPTNADGRAWGAILQDAVRAGYVVRDGFAPANSSNRSPKCNWRSLVFIGSEQHA